MATTYKILGQAAPDDTSNADLYTVPSATQAVISNIHIANVTAAAVAAKVYVVPAAGSASDANIFVPDSPITANGFLSLTVGITLGAGDKLVVRSATGAALTFHAFGSEVA